MKQYMQVLFWEAMNTVYISYSRCSQRINRCLSKYKNDVTTAQYWCAHAGVYERERMDGSSTITDDATLAVNILMKQRVEPTDAHFVGFLGSFMMFEADVHGDEN